MKRDEWIICECSSLEHFMQISYEPDFDEYVYVTIHLSELPFWKRLIFGIKYIFGYKSKYGNFEEIILGKKKLKKTIDVFSQCYQCMKKTEQDINF